MKTENKGQFKKGHIPWDKGMKRPDLLGDKNPSKRPEVVKKIKKSLEGRVHKQEWEDKRRKRREV